MVSEREKHPSLAEKNDRINDLREQNQELIEALKEIFDDYSHSVTRSLDPWKKFHNYGKIAQQALDETNNLDN